MCWSCAEACARPGSSQPTRTNPDLHTFSVHCLATIGLSHQISRRRSHSMDRCPHIPMSKRSRTTPISAQALGRDRQHRRVEVPRRVVFWRSHTCTPFICEALRKVLHICTGSKPIDDTRAEVFGATVSDLFPWAGDLGSRSPSLTQPLWVPRSRTDFSRPTITLRCRSLEFRLPRNEAFMFQPASRRLLATCTGVLSHHRQLCVPDGFACTPSPVWRSRLQ